MARAEVGGCEHLEVLRPPVEDASRALVDVGSGDLWPGEEGWQVGGSVDMVLLDCKHLRETTAVAGNNKADTATVQQT